MGADRFPCEILVTGWQIIWWRFKKETIFLKNLAIGIKNSAEMEIAFQNRIFCSDNSLVFYQKWQLIVGTRNTWALSSRHRNQDSVSSSAGSFQLFWKTIHIIFKRHFHDSLRGLLEQVGGNLDACVMTLPLYLGSCAFWQYKGWEECHAISPSHLGMVDSAHCIELGQIWKIPWISIFSYPADVKQV